MYDLPLDELLLLDFQFQVIDHAVLSGMGTCPCFLHSCQMSSSCFVKAYPSFGVIQVVHAFRGVTMHQFLNGWFGCEFTIPQFE